MQTFRFLDINTIDKPKLKQIKNLLHKVIERGIFINGPEKDLFELNFSRYTNTNYCVGVGNGLDALQLILKSFRIGKGDEVIVPAHTFIATWLAVSNIGAKAIPVDVDDTFCINPDQIEEKITKSTKAIIIVHLYGFVCNIEKITKISKKYNLKIIEDAAQAHGAKFVNGNKKNNLCVGSLGDAAAFSFYPGKNLGAYGDAGAIVTNNPILYRRAKELSNYGSNKKYIHNIIGFNSRLDEMQAAILNIKLGYLDNDNNYRRLLAKMYHKLINNPLIVKPKEPSYSISVYHLYVVRVLKNKRASFLKYLDKNKIEFIIHYPKPPHKQKAYTFYNDNIFPNAELFSRQTVSLPLYPNQSKAQIKVISKVINDFK